MSSPLMETAERVLANTNQRQPVVLTRGQGCRVWDDNGRMYTDFVAGIAVCNLGHAHPRISEALCRQAQQLLHVSNLYYTVPQVQLAQWLTRNSFADRVFFCNSGAEAIEASLKLARRYFKIKGQPERYRVVAMERSFHGRTMAALSATGQAKIREGFEPVLPGFDFIPFNDLEALKAAIGRQTCAVLLEPLQGEGGVRCPDAEYLAKVRQQCDQNGLLLILDEIQTGMGRTGRLFAHEHFGAAPDIMALAKGIANGLPLGAMLATEAVAAAFTPGAHASTFGGTPVITAAALAVAEVFEQENVVAQCAQTGAYFRERLLWLQSRHEAVEDVRGMGLLLGMKVKLDGDAVVKACLARGFLINCIQGRILRFVPPLIVAKEAIDALVTCLDDVLAQKGSAA